MAFNPNNQFAISAEDAANRSAAYGVPQFTPTFVPSQQSANVMPHDMSLPAAPGQGWATAHYRAPYMDGSYGYGGTPGEPIPNGSYGYPNPHYGTFDAMAPVQDIILSQPLQLPDYSGLIQQGMQDMAAAMKQMPRPRIPSMGAAMRQNIPAPAPQNYELQSTQPLKLTDWEWKGVPADMSTVSNTGPQIYAGGSDPRYGAMAFMDDMMRNYHPGDYGGASGIRFMGYDDNLAPREYSYSFSDMQSDPDLFQEARQNYDRATRLGRTGGSTSQFVPVFTNDPGSIQYSGTVPNAVNPFTGLAPYSTPVGQSLRERPISLLGSDVSTNLDNISQNPNLVAKKYYDDAYMRLGQLPRQASTIPQNSGVVQNLGLPSYESPVSSQYMPTALARDAWVLGQTVTTPTSLGNSVNRSAVPVSTNSQSYINDIGTMAYPKTLVNSATGEIVNGNMIDPTLGITNW